MKKKVTPKLSTQCISTNLLKFHAQSGSQAKLSLRRHAARQRISPTRWRLL